MNSQQKPRTTLEDIARRKEEVLTKIQTQKEAMTQCTRAIVAPLAPAVTIGGRISQTINTGMAIYEGVTLGMKLMRRLRTLLRK